MLDNNPSEVWWQRKQNKVRSKIQSIIRSRMKKNPPYFSSIIEKIAKEMNPCLYVEIGIFACETFNLVSKHCENAIGVDISSASSKYIKGNNTKFIEGTRINLIEELRSNSNKIDLVFIDGNHSKLEVISDFEAVEPFLSFNGLVILHDTWPLTKEQTQVQYCHDAWEVVEILRKKFSQYSFVTLPIHPGMTFIQKNVARPEWSLIDC